MRTQQNLDVLIQQEDAIFEAETHSAFREERKGPSGQFIFGSGEGLRGGGRGEDGDGVDDCGCTAAWAAGVWEDGS